MLEKTQKINKTISFVALGGLGEIGKNTYVFEINEKIFIVDAGIYFPGNELLGINYVIPDYSYLKKNEHKIVGLFITHGHEDHIGGIPFLLKTINIPHIYASGFAINLIEYKLKEHTFVKKPSIKPFFANTEFVFGKIKISFIRLNHSIPDMFGIVIKTPYGNLFHTGDFKIDFTPVKEKAEYHKLTQLGEEKLLCLLSDSTNSEKNSLIPSETKIGFSIENLFKEIKGRIIIATFASNIYRIQQIITAAEKTNRKISVFGKSMLKALEIGKQSKYIEMKETTLVSEHEINQLPVNMQCLLCTGSQGEPLAALSRISKGNHKKIKVLKGDTVIFSSTPIPGNKENINKIINSLYKLGVKIITHGPISNTHTSGHGSENDLKMMLSLTKPKYFIPIHGEIKMLQKHKKIALECGIPKKNILILSNGDKAFFNNEFLLKKEKIKAADVFVDGLGFGSLGSQVLKERKKLSEDGFITIIIVLKKEEIIKQKIINKGFFSLDDNNKDTKSNNNYFLMNQIKKNIKNIIENSDKKLPEEELKRKIVENCKKKIFNVTHRKPLIIPIIFYSN